ncbi:MAG: DUF167 domain-containing protein [Chlamydiia bacterium]|nr:DUF167 domain-containing protein [Chlamydiia bacterium]
MKKDTLLSVKVTPKARAPGITGWHEHVLQVKVSAPPDKGKANEEVIALLSDYFHIPKSHIELLRGHTSPHKHFKLTGVTDTTLFPF